MVCSCERRLGAHSPGTALAATLAVLSAVRFDGRPVAWRLSFSEMVVPYGDPHAPHYLKNAFDAGEEANLTNPDSIVEAVATIGDPSAVIRELPFGAIDGQLVGLTYQLKEQIREVLGVSSFDRGQRANVETAAEANAISAGGMMSRGSPSLRRRAATRLRASPWACRRPPLPRPPRTSWNSTRWWC